VPRRFFFPFQPSYWCGDHFFKKYIKSSKKDKTKSLVALIFQKCFGIISKNEIIEKEALRYKNAFDEEFLQNSIEKIEDEMEAGIEINNLHKVYSRANNHALKGLTVKFYKNEISAFLGHNGAGKSTTMHLLTGLYTPSQGTVKINGMIFLKLSIFLFKP
jgi:ABC-type multidrug transport system fused ATPase/permease subunit